MKWRHCTLWGDGKMVDTREADEAIKKLERKLVVAEARAAQQGLTLATLCDMVLGEEAEDRSDDALVKGVGLLMRRAEAAEAQLQAVGESMPEEFSLLGGEMKALGIYQMPAGDWAHGPTFGIIRDGFGSPENAAEALLEDAYAEIEWQQAENQRLREALEKYQRELEEVGLAKASAYAADKYTERECLEPEEWLEFVPECLADAWRRASAAL